MVNYQNGKIYRIVCNLTGLQYIGSTCMSLATRLYQHKRILKEGKSGTSKLVLVNNDCSIVLLEDFPCDRKELLLQRERFYIEIMDCVNKKVPTRTSHEYYEDHKDNLAENYQLNREKRIQYQKEWNNTNKDKLKEYQKTFKNKNKGVVINLQNLIEEVNIDDEENVKLNIEDIYQSNEYFDETDSILIDLHDKNIL